MTLRHRVRAVERTAGRHRAPEPRASVCDRIEELATLFAAHPTTFPTAVEAGILAAVERQIRAGELFVGAPSEAPL
ncbi:hypothetical protein [Gemmata sp.]|uniref:hypothetical protein n=1 Tax=Gemmata sp. TaxID=1914242 RepID=UPI003F6EE156